MIEHLPSRCLPWNADKGQRARQGGGGLRPGGQVEHVPTPHPAEIVDGNLKMTLGMIWTIILRFAIQDISVEGEWQGGGEDEGKGGPQPRPLPKQHSSPSPPRNLGQGRLAPVVSAEDGAVPQRQRAELPHQVCLPVSVWGLCWGLGQRAGVWPGRTREGRGHSQVPATGSENGRTKSMLN